MIKQALALSFVLISAQAIASTPCPTCKKGYVASSLEEALAARQKVKEPGLKKASLGPSFFQPKIGENTHTKIPVEILMNQIATKNSRARLTPYELLSRARKEGGKLLEMAERERASFHQQNHQLFQEQLRQYLQNQRK